MVPGSGRKKFETEISLRTENRSGNCPLCGTYRQRLQCDRIIPGFKGGQYTTENIQYICANCHEDKSRKEAGEASRKTWLGRKHTWKARCRMSKARKGVVPWNKDKSSWNGKTPFVRGMIPWNKGKKHSPKSINKMKESHSGFRHTDTTRQQMSLSQKERREKERRYR